MNQQSSNNSSEVPASNSQYPIGKNNIQFWGMDVHRTVFTFSALFSLGLTVFTLLFTDYASSAFIKLRPLVTESFDWVFIIAANLFVLVCLWITLSPLGKVVIGGKNAQPEYSFLSWLTMLYAAGMGIGIMFYGVLEPVNHFLKPPLNIDPANTHEIVDIAMSATILHWGFHPWAIYAIVALGLALFCYNKGMPLTMRSAFHPILGDKTWGWQGDVIDTLAIITTVFGMSTTLGYGATQAAGGLNYVFGFPSNFTTQLLVISIITVIAIYSVFQGIEKGIKRLSNLNIFMAAMLCLFVIIVGSTWNILGNYVHNLYVYVTDIPKLSNWLARTDDYYYHNWTTFYWSWWIAWSPFVGMFIARISKGRTVRQFILCTLLIPTLFSALWMTAFGNVAIESYMNDDYMGVVEVLRNWQVELSMFKFLEILPFPELTSFITICLVMIFFITSLDSGALVIDTMAAGGKMEEPPRQRVFWCLLIALVTVALLLGGGKGQQELAALQALSLATALPFTFLILLMVYSIIKGLKSELLGH